MLTAESLIARVVALIVGKSLSRLATLTFDKRKRACRSLTKLYYCVQALDEATDSILRTYEVVGRTGDGSAIVMAIKNHA